MFGIMLYRSDVIFDSASDDKQHLTDEAVVTSFRPELCLTPYDANDSHCYNFLMQQRHVTVFFTVLLHMIYRFNFLSFAA